ncbi:MAG: DUF5678 domain-containing protein [Candidatus Diapherotrites archaeon]|nr:DUF5678 domain-containing protein [Candidatus Diapherotrites archaeon]
MNAVLDKSFDFFLKTDFEKYPEGDWVAIYENKVVAHGNALKQVISMAEKIAPISKVLLSKVKKTARYL